MKTKAFLLPYLQEMTMHRYINVTQYFRITTRHGIAGIIVGFDGVIFKCILTPQTFFWISRPVCNNILDIIPTS